MANVLEVLIELMANGRELCSMACFHGHEIRRPRLCCGTDAVQHAEGGEPLEQVRVYRLRFDHGVTRSVTCFTSPLRTGEVTKEQRLRGGDKMGGGSMDELMGA